MGEKAKLREMGRLTMTEGEPEGPYEYEYAVAIVIEFDSRADLLKAIDAGSVDFEH